MPGKNSDRYIPTKTITIKYNGFTTRRPDDLRPLSEVDLADFTTYEGDVVIYNQFGQIAARVFAGKIPNKEQHNVVSAVRTLFKYLNPSIGTDSFHHGEWRDSSEVNRLTTEHMEAEAFYTGMKLRPLWANLSMKRICKIVDGRFSVLSKETFRQYCDVDARRFYTKSFTMCVINKKGTTPHYDKKDEPEGYCCVVPLGNFTGGDLVFREHKIRFKLKPGDIIFFHSRNILHENLKIEGERYSLVFLTHHDCFTEFGQTVQRFYKQFKQTPLEELTAYQKLSALSSADLVKLREKQQVKVCKKKFKRDWSRSHKAPVEKKSKSKKKTGPKKTSSSRKKY